MFTVFYFADPAAGKGLDHLTLSNQIAMTVISPNRRNFRGAPFEKMLASVGARFLGSLHCVAGRPSRGGANWIRSNAFRTFVFLFSRIDGSGHRVLLRGQTFGKHKLAPKISPGKTWEGVAGDCRSILLAAVSHFGFFEIYRLSGHSCWLRVD